MVDARSGKDAPDRYATAHLANALFADLDTQLSDVKPNAADGGRHPLPSVEKFAAVLGTLGITPGKHVVVYDDKGGANAAARFWWMLRAAGHSDVQVLDGGMYAAKKAGFPMDDNTVDTSPASPYPFEQWLLPITTLEEVEKASHDEDYFIIDVREKFRYDGISEPIDLIAGHIPGAHNIPYVANLDAEGNYLDADTLRENYSSAIGDTKPENVIVHCGSGVTACHTILAMEQAGMEIPSLYVGSWSEWSRNEKPIATNK